MGGASKRGPSCRHSPLLCSGRLLFLLPAAPCRKLPAMLLILTIKLVIIVSYLKASEASSSSCSASIHGTSHFHRSIHSFVDDSKEEGFWRIHSRFNPCTVSTRCTEEEVVPRGTKSSSPLLQDNRETRRRRGGGFPPAAVCSDNPCASRNGKRQLGLASSSATAACVVSALSVPRGGGGGEGKSLVSNDEDEEGSSILLVKLRNVIRSVLSITQRKIPSVGKALKSVLRTMEKITGVRLLPLPVQTKEKMHIGKLRRRKNKEQRIQTANNAEGGSTKVGKKKQRKKKLSNLGQHDDIHVDGGGETIKRDETTQSIKRMKKTHQHKKKASTIANKPSTPNVNTQKHLTQPLKSTSPNYRIQRELREFIQSPPPNLKVSVGKNIRVWIITLTGATNTIYEGETYRLRVEFPNDYPTSPPSVYFLQPTPRHEHVYTNGDICLSLLGKDWRPTMTASGIAVSILSMMSGAQKKSLPMDNARHAQNKPGGRQDDWIYHDDNC